MKHKKQIIIGVVAWFVMFFVAKELWCWFSPTPDWTTGPGPGYDVVDLIYAFVFFGWG